MIITPEEMARLRVPLSALPHFRPDLIWECQGDRVVQVWSVLEEEQEHYFLARHDGDDSVAKWWSEPESWMMLDLSDASTADRCARWLAGRVGLEVGCTAPGWFFHEAMVAWLLGRGRRDTTRLFAQNGPDIDYVVHTLADLDPTDDRRLPDGSRYVDRLALALVCRHVGGTP